MPVYRSLRRTHAGLIADPGEEFGPAATAEVWVETADYGHDTGLIDEQGNRLYRFPDPIGFRLRR